MKLLLKTLMITIISCSLSFSEMIAYAQSNGQVTEVSKGVYQKQSSDKVSGVKDDDMMSSITMIAVGFIASRLYKYKLTTDMMIAAAGGAAFIYGEIATTKSYKEIAEDMAVQITNRSDNKKDEKQIESLKKLKASYEEAKKSIGTKKTMQLTAAAAFAAAGLAAIFLKSSEEAAFNACQAALTAGASTCPGGGSAAATTANTTLTSHRAAREAPKPTSAGAAESKSFDTALTTEVSSAVAGFQSTASIALASTPVGTALAAACQAAAAEVQVCNAVPGVKMTTETISAAGSVIEFDTYFNKNEIGIPNLLKRPPTLITVHEPRINKNYFEKLIEMAMPKAHASMMNLLLGGGGAAAGILLSTVSSLGPMVDTYLLTPMKRGIIWGVLAGLSFMASQASQKQLDKIEENIKKIDQLIAELEKQSKAINAQNIASQKVDIANGVRSVNGQDITLGSNGQKTPCIASSGNTNCTSMQATMTALPDFAGLPDSMKTLASNFAKLGDNMSGTDRLSASTLSSASALGNKAGAINKSLRKKQADLNSLRKKNGQKEIDFDGDQRKLLSRMNGAVKGALQKGNMSPAGFFAAVNATPFSNTVKEDPKGDLKKVGVANTSAAPIKKLAAPAHDDFDLKDALESNDSGVLADGSKEGSANDLYDMKGTEINPDNGISIFELISNRYQKSGYPKLLEEETPVDIEQK